MSYNQSHYFKRREEYIAHLGGECVNCGAIDNLNFDHIVAKDKVFNISSITTHSRTKVLAELAKCQLLCKSCHVKKTQLNGETGKSWNKGSWKHGTASAYRIGCRCDDCRSAYSVARKAHWLKTKH